MMSGKIHQVKIPLHPEKNINDTEKKPGMKVVPQRPSCFEQIWITWLTAENDEPTEDERSKSNNHNACYRDYLIELKSLGCFDLLFATFVVCPMVVGSWRGLWSLLDLYDISTFNSLVIGGSLQIIFVIFKGLIFRTCTPKILTYPGFFVISRMYTCVFSFACIAYWRGVWYYVDEYPDMDEYLTVYMTIASILFLLILRRLSNLDLPVFSVRVDTRSSIFDFPTMYRIEMGVQETSLYIVDCVFSVLVIGTLVVFVWRGVWALLDIYLYPNHLDWSAWSSLMLGYGIVLVVFVLQTPMKFLCEKIVGIPRIILADLYLFLSFCGTVNVWRGIWELLNIYFLPENPELSYWITHVVCLLVLILLNCSNSVLVRGVYIDAEEEGGKCVVFPCYYLRLYFQTKRKEKQQKMQLEHLKMVMSARRKSEIEKCAEKYPYPDYDSDQANNSTGNHHVHLPLMPHHHHHHHVVTVDAPQDNDAK